MEMNEPRTFMFDNLTLPRISVYHHDLSSDAIGPSKNSNLFVSDHNKIPIYFIDALDKEEGVQKRKMIVLSKEIHKFIRENDNKFILDPKFKKENILKAPIGVVSYTLIKELYSYRTLPLTPYYEWSNIQFTLFKHVNDVALGTRYHQFVIIDIPYFLPSLTLLRRYEKITNMAMLHSFPNNNYLTVLDFWRFINPETRELSTMNALSKESWKFVNFIIRYENIYYLVNLEKLMGFSELPNGKEGIIKPEQNQKLFLKSLLSLHKTYADMESNVNNEILSQTDDEFDPANERDTEDEEGNSLQEINVNKNTPKVDDSKKVSKDEIKILEDESDLKREVVESELSKMLDTLDEDLNEIDKISIDIQEKDDLEDHKEESDNVEIGNIPVETIQERYLNYIPPEQKILNRIELYKKDKLLNPTDYKSNIRSYERFQNMKNPYGTNEKLNDYIKIDPKDLQITDEEKQLSIPLGVVDPRMAQTSITPLDKKYINNVMRKDILSISKSLMNANLLIDDYSIDQHNDMLGKYEVHTIKVKPVIGPASTIHFKIPVVDENGEIMMSGKKYYLRKQRQDLPIRKINDRQVALTSYYGKTFINKDEKVVNNLSRWLGTKIRKDFYSDKTNLITKAISSNVFNPEYKLPRLYSALAQQFLRVETNAIVLYFDYEKRNTIISDEALKDLENEDRVFVGYEKKTKYPLFLNFQDELIIYDGATFKTTQSVYELLGIEETSVPVEHITIDIFSKSIPVVIVLGYLIGLNALISLLKPKLRVINSNERSNLQNYEYEVKFKDKKLIFDRRDMANSLIFAGLTIFEKHNKNVPISAMNDKIIYFDYYKELGLSSIYLKETDLYNDMFVDPITLSVLEEMQYPLTFIGLLIKSAEMLVLDNHPSSVDMDYMRIRCNERIPGIVYKELVSSLREYRNRSVVGKSQFAMNPFAVWRAINEDAGVSLVSDINPIQNLKQQEGVTFSGTGGRSKDTIVARDRIFNESDTGVISEATSDSSDAGVNTYLTANPCIKNLRGMKGDFDFNKVGSAGALSTSVATAVGATNDDPKRANFISIQNSHTVGCDSYRQSYVRTGYEYIIPQRTKALFCKTAEKNGQVVSLDDKGIVVQYDDNTTVGVKLGYQYGDHEGSTFRHLVITPLKLNQKVKIGDAIAYNTSFFEPDFFDPSKIVYKNTITSKVVLMESQKTLEDSCSISETVAEKLRVNTTHIKSVVINFNQNILKVHSVGNIAYGDVLCFIEDEITSNTDVFNEENINTLLSLSRNVVKSKYNGTLDKIVVVYHGDKEDMSPTLRKLADQSDRALKAESKSINAEPISGSVNSDYRVDGNPLLLDTAEIQFFITTSHNTGVGDKTVFAHQMKSVIGDVFKEPLISEDGEIIDAIFGAQSIANRIVMSPYIIGTTITLLKKIAENAVKIYKG
jgi:hypothetical protein